MRVIYLLSAFNLVLLVWFLGETKINADEVYVVYMGKTHIDGTPRNDHAQLLDELKKRKKTDSVLHTYNKSFLGFAAYLSDEEAESIARRDGVVSVFPDKVSQLHTTRSWDFLMTQTPGFIKNGSTIPLSVSNWQPSGADTIIGFLDSGIWPYHPSFNDEYMSKVPAHWKGICMSGTNSSYPPFKCNRKVIGLRYYDDPAETITTALDEDGHGTITASVAAGKPVWRASYKGLAKGIARGGSPSSRIAVYHICRRLRCTASITLKAFDDAIADGVDVLSISAGRNQTDLLTDPFAIGAFHAVEKGLTVVCSAGNSGPSPGTIENFAPWILTVGATTIDREFETVILLGGNKKIKGGGINFSSLNKSAVYPLVDGRSAGSDLHNASNCIPGSLDGAKVKRKIVLCEYNNDLTPLDDKMKGLMELGAIGVIMIDNVLMYYPFDYNTYPYATVGHADGVKIRSYINSTRNPLATIFPTVTALDQKPAPVVADFSSRGPPVNIKGLLKPDVVAPGVGILTAVPPLNDTIAGTIEPLFEINSGTSLSCPHVSGLAATVKSQNPTWSPSAIRSAIMTTGRIFINVLKNHFTTTMLIIGFFTIFLMVLKYRIVEIIDVG